MFKRTKYNLIALIIVIFLIIGPSIYLYSKSLGSSMLGILGFIILGVIFGVSFYGLYMRKDTSNNSKSIPLENVLVDYQNKKDNK